MRRAWNEYRQIWGEVKVRPVEIRDLGDRVLMLGHIHGRGKGSGMPFDAPVAMLFSLRDGQIVRSEDFPNHEQGLRAAGVVE
jgi:ketosteroid isomerase-like protein